MADVDNMISLIERIEKKPIFEGIDIDEYTRTVTFNPKHEENVNTSVEDNPTSDETIVPGVKVWSIFKRVRGAFGDGNPLLYALKNEKGWKFRSYKDKYAVERQFDAIAEKFALLYPIGVTIMIPSGNELNYRIATRVMSKSKNAKLLEGVICKLTTEEVEDIVMANGSKFRKHYGKRFNNAIHQLYAYLDDMDKEGNGTFSRHFVKDSEMRDVLDMTLKVSPDKYATYANAINQQDVLIIDDTISRGQTIKEACRIMQESYAPKSITVLTLLSKLD